MVARTNWIAGGGWVRNMYSQLLNQPRDKNYYKSGSRDVSDITGRLMSFFFGQQTNRRSVPSNFAGRHQEATITSQLVFNCRIIHEYRVSRKITGPKKTTMNGKNVICGNSLTRKCSRRVMKTQHWSENSETFSQVKSGYFFSNYFQPLGIIIACFFIATKQLTGNSMRFLLPPWWVSSQFQHRDTWKEKLGSAN